MIEILSPAGDEDSFYAAVSSGANAVYLGLNSFNARAKAKNFTLPILQELINYAHLFNVRVYVTINTLIKDSELSEIREIVGKAIKINVDAFIVQDIGVVEMLIKAYPGITLHASTQMGIHNLPGAMIAKELGIKRIVLSRETKLEDIKLIKEKTGLEIEYFVHGALCVSFSGNCYFSSYFHGESGNRGRCLQLCRLPYTANENGKNISGGFLLSPSDLCLMENLKTLIDVGVDSFKIEGRMKRAGYVSTVVKSYVKAVKLLQENKLTQEVIEKEQKNLLVAFSRGNFNEDAYLKNNDNIINKKYNNHVGIEIGNVTDVKPFKDIYEVTLNCNRQINGGDGLKFFKDDKEVASVGVGNVVTLLNGFYKIYTKTKLQPNLKVNLILDYKYENALLQEKKKLKITGKFISKINENATLTFVYGKTSVVVKTESVIECAKSLNTTSEEIKQQLSKLNDTHFILSEIKIEKENVFLPKSVLNKLRRDACELLLLKIIEDYNKNMPSVEFAENIKQSKNNFKLIDDIYVVENIENVTGLIKNNFFKSAIFMFAPNEYTLENVTNFYTNLNKLIPNAKKGLVMPIIAFNKDIIVLENILNNIDKNTVLLANNLYAVSFAKMGFPIVAGYQMNALNSESAKVLEVLGCVNVINSCEQNESLFIENAYVYSFGYLTLMNFCHCPVKTIHNSNCVECKYKNDFCYLNEKGSNFLIRKTKISNCYFELLSDKIICYKKHKNPKFYDVRNVKVDIITKSLCKNEVMSETTFGLYKKDIN